MNREKLRLLLAIILLALPFVYTHAEETTDFDYVLVTDVSQLQEGQEYALLSNMDGTTNPRCIDSYNTKSTTLDCNVFYISEFIDYPAKFNSSKRNPTGKNIYHIGIEPASEGYYIKNGSSNSEELFWSYGGGSKSLDIGPLPDNPSEDAKHKASWNISFDLSTGEAIISNVYYPSNRWFFVSKSGTFIIEADPESKAFKDAQYKNLGLRLYRKVNPDNPLQGEEKTASPVPTPAAGTQDNPTALYAPEALTFSTTSGTVSYSLDGTSWAEVGTDGISLYDLADKQAKTVKLQFKAKEEGKTESDVIEGWYTFKYRSATTFEFKQTEVNIKEGETVSNQLSVIYDNPDNDTPPIISYTSSNTSVATVDEKGIVTVVAPGSTTISASFEDNEKWRGASASYTLTVTELPKAATPNVNTPGGNSHENAMPIYSPTKITVTRPAEGKILYRNFTSNNDNADWSDVPSDGIGIYDTNKMPNTVHLQFKAVADGKKDSEIVDGWYTFKYRSATLSFAQQTLSLEQGKTGSVELTATFDAPNNEEQPISYNSSDETVATVDQQGKVTAIKPGSAVITATTAGDEQWQGAEATFTVTVTAPVVPTPTVYPAGGDSENNATAIYAPKTLKVTSQGGQLIYRIPDYNNNSDMVVPDDGIFIIPNGKTSYTANVICFVWNNEGKSKEVSGWYTFKYKSATLSFDNPPTTSNAGETIEKAASIIELDSPDKEQPVIKYTSSDATVATVDANGKVTLLKAGEATITASIEEANGWKPASDSYTVKVNKATLSATDFCFDHKTVTAKFGETITPSTLTKPTDAHGTITYNSSDPTNFQINQTNGNIELVLKAGTYTITANLSNDPKYENATASYTITVTKADASLSLTYDGNPVHNEQPIYEIVVLQAESTNLKPYTLTVSPGFDFDTDLKKEFDQKLLTIDRRSENGDEHQRTNTFYLKALKAGQSVFTISTPETDTRNETTLQFTVKMEKLNVNFDFSKWNGKTLDLRTDAQGPDNNRKLTLDFTKTLTAGKLRTDGIDIWNYIEATADNSSLNVITQGDKIVLSNLQPGEVNISVRPKSGCADFLNITGGSFKIILAEAVAKPSFSKTDNGEAIAGGTEQEPTVIYLNNQLKASCANGTIVKYRFTTEAEWSDLPTDGIIPLTPETRQYVEVKAVTADGSRESEVAAGWFELRHKKATLSFRDTQYKAKPGDKITEQTAGATVTETDTADAPPIIYSSSDESVATVDDQGIVTVVGEGEITITASIKEDEGWAPAEASYTLISKIPRADTPTVTTTGGDSPDNAPVIYAPTGLTATCQVGVVMYSIDGGVNWQRIPDGGLFVEDDSNASVTVKVMLKSTGNGIADSQVYEAYYTFRRRSAKLSFPRNEVEGIAGLKITDNVATVSDIDSPDGEQPTLVYSSSDESIAMVDTEGIVTMRSKGTAIITATISNDNGWMPTSADYTVTVSFETLGTPVLSAQGGSSSETATPVYVPARLTAAVEGGVLMYSVYGGESWSGMPANGLQLVNADKSPNTVRVLVKAVAEGKEDSEVKDGWYVFKYKSASLRLAKTELALQAGETVTDNKAEAYDIDAPQGEAPQIAYSSSDTSVATVDADGKVTAVKAGETVVRAYIKEENGWLEREATCKVTVTPKEDPTPDEPNPDDPTPDDPTPDNPTPDDPIPDDPTPDDPTPDDPTPDDPTPDDPTPDDPTPDDPTPDDPTPDDPNPDDPNPDDPTPDDPTPEEPTPAIAPIIGLAGGSDAATATPVYAPQMLTVTVPEGKAFYSADGGESWQEMPVNGLFINGEGYSPATLALLFKTQAEGKSESATVGGWYSFRYRTARLSFSQAEVSGKPGDVIADNRAVVSDIDAPQGASPRVTYTSSDTSVATVDDMGKATLTGEGTTIITARIAQADGWLEASAEYTITSTLPPCGMPVAAPVGGTTSQTATPVYAPATLTATAPEGTVEWRVLPAGEWQEMTSEGIFIAADDRSPQTVEIAMRAVADGHRESDVTGGWYTFKYRSATLYFAESEVSAHPGNRISDNKVVIEAIDAPEGATPRIVYTTSSEEVATITEDGEVTVTGPGEAVLTATIATDDEWNGTSASWRLVSTKEKTPEPTLSHQAGGTPEEATRIYAPERLTAISAEGSETLYRLNDGEWQTLGEEGIFISNADRKPCTVGVWLKSTAPGKDDSETVGGYYSFRYKTAILSVNPVEIQMTTDDAPIALEVTVDITDCPEGATPPPYTFSSSDDGVATVDAQGIVTPTGAGTAVITVSMPEQDGWTAAQAQTTVTVTLPAPPPVELKDPELAFEETEYRAVPDAVIAVRLLTADGFDGEVTYEVPAELTELVRITPSEPGVTLIRNMSGGDLEFTLEARFAGDDVWEAGSATTEIRFLASESISETEDEEDEVIYYTLTGVRVKGDLLVKGIYIRIKDGHPTVVSVP